MKKLFIFIAVVALFSGCSNCSGTKQNEELITAANESADMHTAQISLNYEGVYEGTVSAGGVGFTITITLGKDTFKRTTVSGDTTNTEEGTYKWEADGSTITLESDATPNQFFVGEGRLFILDANGDKVKNEDGELYSLYQKEQERD